MTENRLYHYIQNQDQGHLGHMTPCWTHLLIVHTDLLKGVFLVKIVISLQITELWPKTCFWQVSNSKPNRTGNLKSGTDSTLCSIQTSELTL